MLFLEAFLFHDYFFVIFLSIFSWLLMNLVVSANAVDFPETVPVVSKMICYVCYCANTEGCDWQCTSPTVALQELHAALSAVGNLQ